MMLATARQRRAIAAMIHHAMTKSKNSVNCVESVTIDVHGSRGRSVYLSWNFFLLICLACSLISNEVMKLFPIVLQSTTLMRAKEMRTSKKIGSVRHEN
jgi:hypothetical protein